MCEQSRKCISNLSSAGPVGVDAGEVLVAECGAGPAPELPVAVAALRVRHAHVVLAPVPGVGVVAEGAAGATENKYKHEIRI